MRSRESPGVHPKCRGTVDAPQADMTTYATELIIPTENGHVATFSYGLSRTHGWDVRAQIDDQIVTRHCSSWRGVERLYTWLRLSPETALMRSPEGPPS